MIIKKIEGARWGWNKQMALLQRWCRLPNRYIWFQFSSFALVLWGRTSALFCSSSTFKDRGASLVLATSLAPPRREQIEGFSVQCKGGGCGHVGLFFSKGLVLDFPETHSIDAKWADLASCGEVIV